MAEVVEDSSNEISNAVDNQHDSKRLFYYINRMKLAVAIAVIQSVPKGLSIKEHVLSLVQSFSMGMEGWKKKCQQLEKYVFELQQKLDTINLKLKTYSVCPGLEIDENNDSIVTLNANEITTYHDVNVESNVQNTMEFIKSFLLLDSVSMTWNKKLENEKEICDKVAKSVKLLFIHLKSETGLKIEFSIMERAIKDVHQLLSVNQRNLSPEIIQLTLKFVDDILLDIHRTSDINQVEELHQKSILIQKVAEHRSLTILIFCRLLREITVISDFLETIFRKDNENFLPILHAENAYYALQATEGILNIIKKQNSSLTALKIPKTVLSAWNKTTEQCLSVLGSHFPMYCIYVWSIKSKMADILTNEYNLN